MTSHRPVLGLLFISLGLASGLAAQSEGTHRIRIFATETVVAQGQLVGRLADSVVLMTATDRVAIPISPEYLVERWGRHRATSRGALLGGALGGAAGWLIGQQLRTGPDRDCGLIDPSCDRTQGDGTGGFLGLLTGLTAGGLVGALVGSRFYRTGWSEVDPRDLPPGPSVTLQVAPRGLRVGLVFTPGRAR